MPSLAHSTNHSANATHDPRSCSGITQNISGDSSSRPTVTALAHVARRRLDGHQTSSTSPTADVAPAATRSGPSASTISTSTNVPDGERAVDVHDAVDLRRLAVAAADAGRVDEHLGTGADQLVTAGRRDRVLQLAQLGEPLGHQRVGRPRRRGRRRTCRPPRQ